MLLVQHRQQHHLDLSDILETTSCTTYFCCWKKYLIWSMFQSPKCEIEISDWITLIPRVDYPTASHFPFKPQDKRITVLKKELGQIHIYLDTRIFILAMLINPSDVSWSLWNFIIQAIWRAVPHQFAWWQWYLIKEYEQMCHFLKHHQVNK